MINWISQSFIKDMRYYMAGEECGNIIIRKYLEEKLIPSPSLAMEEGRYFEFLVSGSMGKAGVVPEPRYMKRAEGKASPGIEDMLVEFRRAHFNAKYVLEKMAEMGFKIVSVNAVLKKGRMSGDIDLIVELTKDYGPWKAGQRLVVDLKYSGLIYDKWEKFGWAWSNIQKEYHGTQAIQYHFITGLPFLFWVVSNTNKEVPDTADMVRDVLKGKGVKKKKTFEDPDMKVFHVPVQQHMIDRHIAEANRLHDNLKTYSEIGLVARPSYSKCRSCALRLECKDVHDYPRLIEVDLTIE